MSIVTTTGDDGTTGLMYNRRVSKSHPRVEACGTVDELNAALGLARAAATDRAACATLLALQRDLVILMGELATQPGDLARYLEAGFAVVTTALTAKLDALARECERPAVVFTGWAMPGQSAAGAALDFARTVCRRAERRVCALHEAGQLANAETLVYLNRLGDVLWLLARRVEADNLPPARP